MTDCIEIRGLRVLGRHGALAGERAAAQPFVVDLDLHLDLRPAASSDDLARTVDYGPVVERAAGVVATTSFALLETLAQAIADSVLEEALVAEVRVRLHKARPPIAADVASVGVVISRQRQAPGPDHR